MRISDWSSDVCSSDLFLGEGEHYESRYHLTLTWLPTPDSAEAAGRSLVERPDAEQGRDWHGALSSFIAESDRAPDLFASFMPEVRADRKSVVWGKSVSVRVGVGGPLIIKKKKK